MQIFKRPLQWLSDDLNFLATAIVVAITWLSLRNPQLWMIPWLAGLGAISLAVAVLLIGRWNWGRWICFGYVLVFGAVSAFGLAQQFSWGRLIAVSGAIWCLVDIARNWHQRDGEETDKDWPHSLVALVREHGYLDAAAIARAATQAWGTPFTAADASGEQTENYVVGENPLFLIRRENDTIAVHHQDRPYFDDVKKFSETVWEGRHRQAVLAHKAWISVDLLNRDEGLPPLSDAAIYEFLGPLLAELIDDQCVAILCPRAVRMFVYDEETEANLRRPDPIRSLDDVYQAPIVHVAHDDPRMLAAVTEARARWPEFEQAFVSRSEDETYSIKFPLREGDEVEFIWAMVTAIENGVIFGTLGNDPIISRSKMGDRIQTRVAEVYDWLRTDAEGAMHGGFTVKVLSDARDGRQRARDDGSSE
ncbi:MAG: DUF2314 domain-containing protein [Planctomycetaceae bacterium]|nr:DUF2314 domain-containing protein [Planctomycetaceae bacterium]